MASVNISNEAQTIGRVGAAQQKLTANYVPNLAMSQPGQPTSFWARNAQTGAQKQNALLSFASRAAKDVGHAGAAAGRFVGTGVAKLANTAVAEGKQAGYTAEMALASHSHNPTAFKNANTASQNAYKNDNQDHKGILGVGTAFKNGKEAQSGALTTGLKRIGGTTLQAAGDVLPMGKLTKAGKIFKAGEGLIKGGSKISSLASKEAAQQGGKAALKSGVQTVAKNAGIGGASAGLSSAGAQLTDKGKISVGQTAKNTAAGVLVGGAIPLATKGVGKVFKAGSQVALDKIKGTTKVADAKAAIANKGAMHDVMSGEQADKAAAAAHTKISVNQAPNAAEKIAVKTPLRPGIKQVSETNKITVRTPQKMSDQQFHSEFNKLNTSYTKDTQQLEKSSKLLSPQQTKVASNSLETKYQAKLNDLQDRYHNPQLSSPVAPKKLSSQTFQAGNTTGGTQKLTASKVSELGGSRPNNALQSQIEKAHNTGDSAKTEQLIQQLPDASTRDAMRSSVGIPTKETKLTVNADTGKATRVSLAPGETAKISGSALKSEQRAVEQGMVKEFENKATYTVGSHKTETANAVKLTHEDPQKALDIAMGRKPGNNALHEVAVRHAVENKAAREGDISTLQRLASSKQHSVTSEAAQRLGAEGYHSGSSNPVEHMRDINATRTATYEKKTGASAARVLSRSAKEIDSHIKKPTKGDWNAFISSIQC